MGRRGRRRSPWWRAGSSGNPIAPLLRVNAQMDKNPKTNSQMGAATPVAKAAAPPGEPGGGVPNPIVLLRRALHHWPVIGLTLILGLAVTAQITRSRKPTYKS